jgi:glyoxylase-like metal-dependent hydrolase (beta-lactamase superfamily II)/predicted ester cyclase
VSTSDVAKRYFKALAEHDLSAAMECWKPGGLDRFVGQQDLIAPDGIRAYFEALFAAFPDFRFEVVDVTTYRNRTAVRWRARATFAGPGSFQGFAPTGARVDVEGCDVVTVQDELIVRNEAYFDSGSMARQLGLLPPAGSAAQTRIARLTNARSRTQSFIAGAREKPIADGVWIVRGGFPLRTMNVYLLQEGDGTVTVFDAGISAMTGAVAAAGARLGGIKRVVLGHADADHRGTAPGIGAPVYCHPAEQAAAESPESLRSYFDLAKLNRLGRFLLGRLLPVWDGGAVEIAGTVKEGEKIAGFRVIELPGHAPGLIGLYREEDRLALVSDCFYTVDPQTGRKGTARVPHPAFDVDIEQARESIRKLAEIEPAAAWPGHADPVTGNVRRELERAAAAPI